VAIRRNVLAVCLVALMPTVGEAQLLQAKHSSGMLEVDTQALRSRAKSLLDAGDLTTARLFLKRASDMGDKQAATELAEASVESGQHALQPQVPTIRRPTRANTVPEHTGTLAHGNVPRALRPVAPAR
jgi:hypothetical protein